MTDSTDIRITALTLAVQAAHGEDVEYIVVCAEQFLAFLEPPAPEQSAEKLKRTGKRTRWTPELDAKIKRMTEAGESSGAISNAIGAKPKAVQLRRYRLGITHPTPKQIASLELARGSRNAKRNGASPA